MTFSSFITENNDYLFAFLAFLIFVSFIRFIAVVLKTYWDVFKNNRL